MPSTVTSRLDGLTTAVAVKAPVVAATTAAITLSGEQTVDGVACVDGDRVLVKNQASSSANGIYVVSTGAWARSTDCDGNRDLVNGTIVNCTGGTINEGVFYECAATDPITIGTTAITWEPSLTSSASVLSFTQGGTGAVAQSVEDKLRQFLHVDDYGAVGDGTTDDEAAITYGIARSVTLGLELHFDGSKTYAIDASSWTITAGSKLRTNGATIKCLTTTTGNTVWCTVGDDVVVDELNVLVPAGIRRDRAITLDGDDIRIGKISLVSIDQQANTEADDGGVQIMTGARNFIGMVSVEKYDRAVIVANTADCTILKLFIESYVRGLYAYDNTDLHVAGGRIHTASANAAGSAGSNGVLLQCTVTRAQNNVTFENLVVEDASEHGWRIGGPEIQSNIKLSNCSAWHVGGCGLKLLGTDSGSPTANNRNIVVDHFIAEDCGTDFTAAGLLHPNRCGILVKFVTGVHVVAPIVRLRSEAASASYGLVFDGATNVVVDSPLILGTTYTGIYGLASDGDNTQIQINGGISRDNGVHGLHIYSAATKTTARFEVNGISLVSNSDLGFEVETVGTTTSCLVNARTANNVNGAGACDSTQCTLQISGVPGSTALSGITARTGSWFDDTTNLNVKVGTAWVPIYSESTSPVIVTDATYAIGATVSNVIANRAGTVTVTLPSAATYPGRELRLKTIQAQTVVSDASNVVPITDTAAGTAILAGVDGAWALLKSDGTNWVVMAS